MWDADGRVAHLTYFFTKNSAIETLLWSQLRFTFRSYLADEDISGVHFRTDSDNPLLIKVFQRIIRHVGNLTRNLFRTELRIARLALILGNVDRRIDIVPHQAFTEQDRIFVVETFPHHEPDQYVSTQCEFAVVD